MKSTLALLLTALVLFAISSVAGRADQFSEIENCPFTYWVPPPAGYVGEPYYYGPPPPVYYGPPPPVVVVPRFFFGFRFH